MKKVFLVLMLTLGIQFPVITVAEECIDGDCENGVGTGFTDEGAIYSGEWKDGLPHGIGKLTISKDNHLEGKWEEGVLVEEKNNKP
jgi:hypothetical protein